MYREYVRQRDREALLALYTSAERTVADASFSTFLLYAHIANL
jgi:hypothetical protein